jgi:hypothetical protein
MQLKYRMLIAVLLITLICWFEIQYLTEGFYRSPIPEKGRHLVHLLLLVTVTAVGYWGWKTHPMKWLSSLWVLSYAACILFLLVMSIVYLFVGHFNADTIGTIRGIRLFFCSPMPFLLLFVLSRINLK